DGCDGHHLREPSGMFTPVGKRAQHCLGEFDVFGAFARDQIVALEATCVLRTEPRLNKIVHEFRLNGLAPLLESSVFRLTAHNRRVLRFGELPQKIPLDSAVVAIISHRNHSEYRVILRANYFSCTSVSSQRFIQSYSLRRTRNADKRNAFSVRF